MVSNASEDFPDPLKPVITVKVLRGISTSIFFKLCCRAPCTVMRLIIARGKPYFSSAWLLLVLAGGGWFARGAARGSAMPRDKEGFPHPVSLSQNKRQAAPLRKRDFRLWFCFVGAAAPFYFCDRCDHFTLGGYFSKDFFTMSSSLGSILVASPFSTLAMARQTSERVLGSRRSIT